MPLSNPASGIPLPMTAEVVRNDVLIRLESRWSVPITLVIAGAGFGKSTALAQAIRANAVEPRGIDVWYSCVPGDENAEVLGRALLTALGGRGQQPDLVGQLVDALTVYSPLEVCLVIDDAHEIRPDSSAAELMTSLVRCLPYNAHLVIASRLDPAIALSKRRAAHGVVEVTDEHLLFSSEESALFAKRLGRNPDSVANLGGWPALVRLALSVRPDLAASFAREEVLDGLTGNQRRTLFVLSNLGLADERQVAEVLREPVDLGALATAVPMIATTEDGRFRAHDLWRNAVLRTLDHEQSTMLRARVIDWLIDDMQLARAGQLAVAHHDIDLLLKVSLEMVSRSISVLPVDIVRPWNDVLQRSVPEAPATILLLAAITHSLDFADASVDALVDQAMEGFRSAANFDGEIAALAMGTVAAHSRGDFTRLITLAARVKTYPQFGLHPVANFASHAVAAVVAEMSGDVEGALSELRAAHLELVPSGISTAVQRFLFHCLLVNGEADEAANLADRMVATTDTPMVRYLPTFARWMNGQPETLLHLGGPPEHEPGTSSRDQFVRHTMIGFVWSCLGGADEVKAILHSRWQSEHARLGAINCRDEALAAILRALDAVLSHNDNEAARHIDELMTKYGDEPVVEQHLHRFLPVSYVVSPVLQCRWDTAQLGPSHRLSRRVARLLVELRKGAQTVDTSLINPAHVLTSLPLPWSIELSCRLHSIGDAAGQRFADWLVEHVTDNALIELRLCAGQANEDGPVRLAAADLLRRLPAPPSNHTNVSVLGPLTITIDGVPVESAQLRRSRVRSLLALLTVQPTMARERVIDLLWPDLGPTEGARNLRVTLTYLRQLIEPQRLRGEAAFHVRADGDTIRLHVSDSLTVDLWEQCRLTDEAESCRRNGDIDATITKLAQGTALWRGDPLVDLCDITDHESVVEQTRLTQCRAVLQLGELRMARGLAAEAMIDAERALTLDPYLERAHRLALAAALQVRDFTAVATAERRVTRFLEELGVTPEPATQILLRQASPQSSTA
jgi:LuxR family transcriptional regulator, maltose regulon positive regulatory protein